MTTPQNITDVQSWPSNSLPIVSMWNTGGFTFDWHVEQVRAGNRFLPTTKLDCLRWDKQATLQPATAKPLKPDNEEFLRDNKLPLSVRTDNIATMLGNLPRLPKVRESIPLSPLIWVEKPDGTIDDSASADYFGPLEPWSRVGETWAWTGAAVELQRRFPDAPCVILGDNYEAGYDKPNRYSNGDNWLPAEKLAGLSIRARDYAATHTVDEFHRTRIANQMWQYRTLFDAFDSVLTAWKGRVRTECYETNTLTNSRGDIDYCNQYVADYNYFDGGGSPIYISDSYLGDFTGPDWFNVYFLSPVALKAESLNPKHFRSVFLQFLGSACYAGYQAGRHEIITPERAQAATEFLLWSIRGKGRPVMLRYWLKSTVGPTSPYLDSEEARNIVTDAGHPEIAEMTEMDYLRPVLNAVNRICENETLRRFWLDGNPVVTGTHPGNEIRAKPKDSPIVFPEPVDADEGFRLLECDANTPRSQWVIQPGPNSRGDYNPAMQIKVWATATELHGEYLLQFFTPCKTPLSFTATLPNGWKYPVTMTQPGKYVRLKPNGGFEAEEID